MVSTFPLADFDMPYEVLVREHQNDEDVITQFLSRLLTVEKELLARLFDERRLQMSADDDAIFAAQQVCTICNRPFFPDLPNRPENVNARKVRDHCHITGLFRGAAHSICNLQARKDYQIPVFFHNMRGYDGHFITRALDQVRTLDPVQAANHKVTIIGQTLERYLQMCWGPHLVFRDSCQILNASLETLVANLAQDSPTKFAQVARAFNMQVDDVELPRLLRKGVFPYDWFNSFDRLEVQQLPSREEFFSLLAQTECKETDYAHAQEMWRRFGCNNMADYMKLYLMLDVLQLADVFESFRDLTLKYFGLDAACYVSAPSLSWDAMLKITGVNLQLLTDSAMYNMMLAGIRGGVCMVSKRHAIANNPAMPTAAHANADQQQQQREQQNEEDQPIEYDPARPPCWILDSDVNNLYGRAMSEPLAVGEFAWCDEAERRELKRIYDLGHDLATSAPSHTGYILDVDLEYPTAIHNATREYPLAPESVNVSLFEPSPFLIGLHEVYNLRPTELKKLVPNLHDKDNYIVYHRNLDFYVAMGMRVKSINRAIRFKEEAWLKCYVDLCTSLRMNARSPFERDLFKLLINAIYGKMIENLMKRSDIKLTFSGEEFTKFISKPHCRSSVLFTDSLGAVNMRKVKTLINRPTYIGVQILEISKLLVYHLHYNHFKPTYGAAAHLLYTDTDSLVYQIQTPDIFADCYAFRENVFDMSTLPPTSEYYDATQKDVPGLLKIETKGNIVTEFIALAPKMYSFTEFDPTVEQRQLTESRRAKGIQRAARNILRHKDYRTQLIQPRTTRVRVRRIGSKLHILYTIQCDKRGLTAVDDKRYLLNDGINSQPHGHFALNPNEQMPGARHVLSEDVRSDQQTLDDLDNLRKARLMQQQAESVMCANSRADALLCIQEACRNHETRRQAEYFNNAPNTPIDMENYRLRNLYALSRLRGVHRHTMQRLTQRIEVDLVQQQECADRGKQIREQQQVRVPIRPRRSFPAVLAAPGEPRLGRRRLSTDSEDELDELDELHAQDP